MKVIDISKEMLSSDVYPGDPPPEVYPHYKMDEGDSCNLSIIEMSSHSATHIDAPKHFGFDGTVTDIPLESCVGPVKVVSINHTLTGEDIERLDIRGCDKVIFRTLGKYYVSQSAAFVLADRGIKLVGVDSQSIGCVNDEAGPHKELLSRGVVILEGLNLEGVNDGVYFLSALPLKIDGLDGSPVRAVLVESTKGY